MSEAKAFTFNIGSKPNGNSNVPGEEGGSTLGNNISLINQTSPAWVLTFVRWEFRDTLRTPNSEPNTVRKPLVVESDCIQLSVSDNKGVLTANMSAVLVETDTNYATAVHPGDFVFVNILNWESDARIVANNAKAGNPINGTEDGFKGFFKIQGVRKIVHVEPTTGVKTVLVKIDGFAFTEFNNTIYFNPNLINQKSLDNQALYINDISTAWASFVSKAGKPFVQEILAFLIQSLIGSGVNPKAQVVDGLLVSKNIHFLIPVLVGRLLGIGNSNDDDDLTSAVAAKDVYRYLFGIQQYASGEVQDLASGMNPVNLQSKQRYPGFYYTSNFCAGNTLLKPEYWNQVKVWSILNQYTNAPLNELYTCFRVSPNGRVMPTVVFRQIPFTSEDFVTQTLGTQDSNADSIPVTQFLTIPRWKIGSESIYTINIGTDEAARINFVQYYARSNFSNKGMEISGETALRNYIYDADDIARSGLRPYVVQNQFDDLPDALIRSAPVWARVFGDAVIGGHLKLNGSLECIGIVDPIAVGDNLEFDGTVFHLEQINHSCSINVSTGMKTFRTTLSVSHGVSVNSSEQGTVYSQMAFADGYRDRENDFSKEQILPGVSESQDNANRINSLDTNRRDLRDEGFPQPSSDPDTNKFGE